MDAFLLKRPLNTIDGGRRKIRVWELQVLEKLQAWVLACVRLEIDP
jgi:hypothetical protein